MQLILAGPGLDTFRLYWDGKQILDLVKKHRRFFIDWPVGVGKSFNQDSTIKTAIVSQEYDLVIALLPTRQLINEREWIRNPPLDIKIVNLEPRPKIRCGGMNKSWEKYESNNLGMLGRSELCGNCRNKKKCKWPKQFGKSLKGANVVFGAQTHLDRSPYFFDQIISGTGAKKVLVILDEANFIMKTFRRQISFEQLKIFYNVLEAIQNKNASKENDKWIYFVGLMLNARTEDLRSKGWRLTMSSTEWAFEVQKFGWNKYGSDFHFLVNEILNFCNSNLASRERLASNDISFATKPKLPVNSIIYSATAHTEFAQYRIGSTFATPFKDHRFEHSGSNWYNIASMLGAKNYFKKNSNQILDFFAGLISVRLNEGKRPLLVSKLCHESFCATEIETRLRAKGFLKIKVVSDCNDVKLLQNKDIIPIIHYGISGTNIFKNFNCVYCLTGYYVSEDIMNDVLQDILATDIKIPVEIKTIKEYPRRRIAKVKNFKDQVYDINQLSQLALDYLEMGNVIQAVGRVRPHTFSREIVTFQCAAHPKLEYTMEFNNLNQAREFFGMKSLRRQGKNRNIGMIQNARRQGATQIETAKKTGLSIRTVKRYWNLEIK